MQRLMGSPSPSQSATAHQQFMLTFGHQKERLADINTKLVLDEATRQRWEKISGFVRGMFDLSREISSWLSRELFVEYYTAVYEFCTVKRMAAGSNTPDGAQQQFLYGEHLYDLLSGCIAENIARWAGAIREQPDLDSLVAMYLKYWARFKEMLEHYEAVFSYLERFLIDVKMDSYHSDSVVRFEYLRPLLMKFWSFDILHRCQSQLLAAIQCCWDPNIPDSTASAIVSVVSSFKTLSMPLKLGPNKTERASDIKDFEASLLPWYLAQVNCKCTERLAVLMQASPDGSLNLEQVSQIGAWFSEECQRARQFLGDETVVIVKDALKGALLQPIIGSVYSLCETFVANEEDSTAALKVIYSVVALRKTLIKPMTPYFERGLLNRAALTLSPGDNDEYFLGLQALFSLTETFLSDSLGKNTDLKAARNSAFSRLFVSVSPGAFALWIDKLLRVGDSSVVNTIPHLVTFVEARIAFRIAYQRLLAQRLLSQDSILTIEEQVLCGMKEALGASFCQPLEKMLHDILTSKDHQHESRKRTKAAYETEVLVLTSSVWPVEPAGDGYAALNTPIPFQHLCASYEKHYKDKHSRRLLYWHPFLSNVQVDLTIRAQTHSLKLSVAQWAILETLTYSPQDIASVSLKSGLAPELICQTLEPLIAVGLVNDALAINSQFAQSTGVLDLMPGHDSELTRNGQSTEELTTEICGPDHASSSRQSYLIQAAIIRHLKYAETSTTSHITKFVADALAGRYHPTEHDIALALKSLESREFIKHDPRKPSNYQYVP